LTIKKPKIKSGKDSYLPDWYNKKLREEFIARESSPEYRDDDLQQVRKTHWQRRLNGQWGLINGKPIYFTGKHWFYMNWWPLRHRVSAYLEKMTDCSLTSGNSASKIPNCGGMVEATNVRMGKRIEQDAINLNIHQELKKA
jgi:hypothetical protein